MFSFSKEAQRVDTIGMWDGELYDSLNSDEILNKKLGKLGLAVTKLLGSGSWGDAFLLSNGNVLKITKDKTEAQSAAYLKGKNLKYVYHVFDVFKFKNTSKIYFIVQERLSKLSKDLNSSIEWMTTEVPRLKEFMQSTEKDVHDISTGLYELNKLGIAFYDVHPGNIMMRGNDYVIIDIGQSKSPVGNIQIYEYKKGSIRKEMKKQITEKREISSILEKIIQQIYKTNDLEGAKTLMIEFINNSNIKDIDKKKMTQMVDTLKTVAAVQLYATNAMLKYEGMGTGYTEKNQRKLDVKESVKKSLKPLIESIIKEVNRLSCKSKLIIK